MYVVYGRRRLVTEQNDGSQQQVHVMRVAEGLILVRVACLLRKLEMSNCFNFQCQSTRERFRALFIVPTVIKG